MATIKKAQSGAKTTKKPKTASQRIGDLTLRDVKNSAETALNLSTLGGYGAIKKGVKKLTGMKSGGTMKKAQTGATVRNTAKNLDNAKTFSTGKNLPERSKGFQSVKDPDYKPSTKKYKNGGSLGMKSVKAGYDSNPGVTRADIITAATKKAKAGAKMKKCKYGCK